MEGTLLSLLAGRAERNSDSALYSFLDRNGEITSTVTYRELFNQAGALAALLQERGCRRIPVLVYCPHGPEFVLGFFACILAECWPVPITRRRGQQPGHLQRMLAASGARAVVTTSARMSLESTLITRKDIDFVCLEENGPGIEAWQRPAPEPDDIAFIQYTSGSTSQPRGVKISHANVLCNSGMIQRAFNCSQDDTGLCWLPLHHDMGLIGHVVQPLFSQIHNYFMSPTDFSARPGRWLRAISRYRATISGGPDFAFSHCVASASEADMNAGLDLSEWRLAYCGAEKVRARTLREFARKFSTAGFQSRAFYPCYGLAESTLFVCGRQGLKQGRTDQQNELSLGRPPTEVSLAIVDSTCGERLADGRIGEVWVKSPAVASDYNNAAEAGHSSFGNMLEGCGGYLRTGDIGRLEDGELYLCGRSKNVVKWRGRSIHAEDMEDMLTRELPVDSVTRTVVLAINIAQEEKIVVLLERARGYCPEQGMRQEELISQSRRVLADRSGVLVDYVFVLSPRSVPLTSSGKVRRQACEAICLSLADAA